MENKKSMKADLENKKHVFLEMGFMVALAALLFAFEWKVSVEESSDYITVSDIPMEVEMVPVTLMSQLPPPPPAPPQLIDMLEIVDELEDVDAELELIDASDESANEEYVAPVPGDWGYGDEASDEIIPFLPSEDMPVFLGRLGHLLEIDSHCPVLPWPAGRRPSPLTILADCATRPASGHGFCTNYVAGAAWPRNRATT